MIHRLVGIRAKYYLSTINIIKIRFSLTRFVFTSRKKMWHKPSEVRDVTKTWNGKRNGTGNETHFKGTQKNMNSLIQFYTKKNTSKQTKPWSLIIYSTIQHISILGPHSAHNLSIFKRFIKLETICHLRYSSDSSELEDILSGYKIGLRGYDGLLINKNVHNALISYNRSRAWTLKIQTKNHFVFVI